jgi:DNA invertase Pin-like site-specific DNA recombinase
MKQARPAMKVTPKVRCAVYTRKSSEEGLDMEFNSLDAQREACEAYIASQKPEGWVPSTTTTTTAASRAARWSAPR